MDAVDALNEIAFWLERELAPTFKVKAFRNAAETIQDLGQEELAEGIKTGRLRRMSGIGDRTFEVIKQSVEGRVPEYLEKLRNAAQPLAESGQDLRRALRGDLHSHSDWSDGGSPVEVMADTARILGHEYLALTDHSPNLKVANGLDAERLRKQLDVVSLINEQAANNRSDGFRLLSGIEVDILEDGTLDQEPELLGRLDVVVASVHSKLRSDKRTMTRRMLGGISAPQTNVLGHCTGRLITGSRGTRPESDFDAPRVFAACAENDVAVEINSRPERRDPPDNLIQVALEAGCLFSIDSDAHAPGQLDFLQYGAERAEQNEIPPERIVTTWPLKRLLEWTGRKR